jgi:uncharacterized protein YbjT (DUF2867 family)
MRALILGGSGLIGSAVAKRLVEGGHEVLLASRHGSGARFRSVDLTRPDADAFLAALENVDVLVNCVGIFDEQAEQSFDAIHVKGPTALYEAARARNVRTVIHVSALGADPASPLRYFASKGQGDEQLLRMGMQAWVVRPSLVYSPQGQSTRFFAALAALPVTPLPSGGQQQIQPVHLDDLAEAIVELALSSKCGGILNAAGPRALSLRDYLSLFRARFGMSQWFTALPDWLARAGAYVIAPLSGGMITSDSLRMLEKGNTADPSPFASVLGRAPREPERFFDGMDPATRVTAQLAWLLPLMRVTTAVMWLVTAWVSAFVYPVPASLRLLAAVGLEGTTALAALYGAAALDAVLGLGTLIARRRRALYLIQLATVAAYTLLITTFLPEYWAHPYGPILKNVPLLAMILTLFYLDRDDGPGAR